MFGAHIAETFAAKELQQNNQVFNYLDIGTGTGLLSLMLAQKTKGLTDAVEIDISASEQAKINFEQSPFKEKLNIFATNILEFKSLKKYDGILCNPPFYENDLHSADSKKNTAKHETHLTLDQLLDTVKSNLNSQGLFAILLPYHRINTFIEKALELNIFIKEIVLIRHSIHHPHLRGILYCTQILGIKLSTEIVIKNGKGIYTKQFIDLLKDYYLNL